MVVGYLAGVIVLAHATETATGFGATIIAASLGAHWAPLESWILTLILLGWLQSAWLAARGWRQIDRGVLLRRILPVTAAGLPLGYFGLRAFETPVLQVMLGGFVVAVAGIELLRLRGGNGVPAPLGTVSGTGVLFAGGIVHGMFATGGPLVVYYASRRMAEKGAFRATLAALWLCLNTVLIATHAFSGALGRAALTQAALLVPAVAAGILAGEVLHRRVPEQAFRVVVQVLLIGVGVSLLV
ncbi:MAG: sulfite exporter TauE/SafE family protein [Nitrospirae bacterium]|nr:sulfite exporter TauE/SafE family protein [Nitrospirota bacterium]